MPLLDKAKEQVPAPAPSSKAPQSAPSRSSRPTTKPPTPVEEPAEPPPKQGSTSTTEKKPVSFATNNYITTFD